MVYYYMVMNRKPEENKLFMSGQQYLMVPNNKHKWFTPDESMEVIISQTQTIPLW